MKNSIEDKELTKYLFRKDKLQKADLVIVFGNRHAELVEKTLQLYKKNIIKRILVSGGINRVTGHNEAQAIKIQLISLGVNEADLIMEDKSTNSLENVLFSRDVIEKSIGLKNINTIIAVVKHYHSRRALMTLKKHFSKEIELMVAPYDVYGFTKDNWPESEIGKSKVLGECEKIKTYLEKGDIEEL